MLVVPGRCAIRLEPIHEGLVPVSVASCNVRLSCYYIEVGVPHFPCMELPIEQIVQAQSEPAVHSLKVSVPGFAGYDTAVPTVLSGRFAVAETQCHRRTEAFPGVDNCFVAAG